MKCVLRPVQESDVTLLYNWRNDELVRKNSFSEGKINFEEHKTWFTSVLRNPHVFFYVLEIDENPIGQVRLNKTGNSCIISYSIAEEYRAQGYGKLILQLIENYCVKKNFADSLIGYVKKNNVASQVIFKSLGYTETDENSFYRYEKTKLLYTTDLITPHNKALKGGGGVLLLTNNNNSLPLYYWISTHTVTTIYSDKISVSMIRKINPSLVISFNYSHIIKSDVIALLPTKLINLHISLLPWNRGSSPNFWSFIEDTPKGVTIHQIDEGLDTGAIIAQQQMYFDENLETLASSYQKLQEAVQDLLKNNWDNILSGNYSVKRSHEEGSFHRVADLKKLIGSDPPYHVKISELKAWVSCYR